MTWVDNVIVLQEVLNHMHKSKKKKGDMVIQLDLEKAYNRVDWDFLRETLILYVFPRPIIALVLHGIQSPNISVFWNGSRTLGFSTCWGLRQ